MQEKVNQTGTVAEGHGNYLESKGVKITTLDAFLGKVKDGIDGKSVSSTLIAYVVGLVILVPICFLLAWIFNEEVALNLTPYVAVVLGMAGWIWNWRFPIV